MAKVSAKMGVSLIAAILVGAGVFAFVAYTSYDAIGFGRVVVYGDSTASTDANQTISLRFSTESKPVVTIWTGAAGDTFNGTVAAAKVTWAGTNVVNIVDDGATFTAYPPDTTFLKFNYTGKGSAARAITMPAIVLVAVFAIVLVAGVMISQTGSLGGKGGGRKKW